jgi:hypothetical protein
VQPARIDKHDNSDTKGTDKHAIHGFAPGKNLRNAESYHRTTFSQGDNYKTVLNIFSDSFKTLDTAVHHEIAPHTTPQTPSTTRNAVFVVALGDWRFGTVVHARSGCFSSIRKADLRSIVVNTGWQVSD